MDVVKWIIENIFEIALVVSILFGAFQTYRHNSKDFWSKLRAVARELVNKAETRYNAGEGSLKREWVVDELLKEFNSKFSTVSKKKLGRIVDFVVLTANSFIK